MWAWPDRLAKRLYISWLRRASKQYQKQLESQLNKAEIAELVEIARQVSESDAVFMSISKSISGNEAFRRELPELYDMLNVKSIIHNPFILPYRAPALRFAPQKYSRLLASTPVITIPNLQFHASTKRFSSSERAFVKVPFGLIFALASIARAAYAVHEDLENRTTSTLKQDLGALFFTAANITAPTPVLTAEVTRLMGTVKILSVAKPAHVMHVMGAFIVLHEYGHVALEHQPCPRKPTPLEARRSRMQEFEADAFALAAILRRGEAGPITWNSVKSLHALCVCLLLLTLELHTTLKGVQPKAHYPSFVCRCDALLNRFSAPEELRRAVHQFSYATGIVEDAPSV